ncbi:hypothetical protein HN865_05615 [Candidatus Woesearchaeota archaeon]|jgi:hypothetical protein|nr:hypothetical protein [Candidatus Woesearchaeota archaeon]
MVIKEILKQLEKITKTKEKISFLMKELKKTKNNKLKQQLELLLEQIIDQESLEERITLRQPEIQTKKPQFQTLEQQLPQQRFIRKQEEDDVEKVDYKLFQGEENYHTGVKSKANTIDPLQDNPNKLGVDINPYKENTGEAYQTKQDVREIQAQRLDESNKDFSTEEILKRQKLKHEDTKYEFT